MVTEILKPSIGKAVWLAVGFFVVPKLLGAINR